MTCLTRCIIQELIENVFISGKLFRVLLLLTTIFTRFPGQFSCRAKCSSKHTIFLQLLLFELQGMMIFKGFFPLVKQPAIKINQFGVIFNITVKWVNLLLKKIILYLFHVEIKFLLTTTIKMDQFYWS